MFKVKLCIVVVGLLICTSSAFAQKIERFTDGEGTVHIGTPSDVVKPGNNTKAETKPEDITKPEGDQPMQRKILPKAQRASRRPAHQYPPGEWPPRHLPSPLMGPTPQPQPPTKAPGAEGTPKGTTP